MCSEGLNELAPECFVEISAEDAKKIQIYDGDLLKVSSRRGSIKAKAKISIKAGQRNNLYPLSLC